MRENVSPEVVREEIAAGPRRAARQHQPPEIEPMIIASGSW